MRLLNVKTMKLEEYFGVQVPKYAILSHCWGEGEVTFQDMTSSKWQHLPGARKTNHASTQCRRDGHEYLWIDTFCIDKSSSAELSEAINSMYSWYEKSRVCYTYLEDVLRVQLAFLDEKTKSQFRQSRWFQRGWTLQELIAPTRMSFFDAEWGLIGTKNTLSLLLSSATGVPEEVLLDGSKRVFSSVARRMSWATKRQTTRLEDIAYCLFGIFQVNMPLLYGEGDKAFIRLQEEIMKETDDQSLFAWGLEGSPNRNEGSSYGVLAASPAAFAGSENVIPIPDGKSERQPYSMTNKGLRIELPLLVRAAVDHPLAEPCPIALLNCQFEMDFSGPLGIVLRKTSSNSVFTRWEKDTVEQISHAEAENAKVRLIYISKHSLREVIPEKDTCLIRCHSVYSKGFSISDVNPPFQSWNSQTGILRVSAEVFRGHNKDPSWASIAFYNDKTRAGFLLQVMIYHRMGTKAHVRMLAKPEGIEMSGWRSMHQYKAGSLYGASDFASLELLSEIRYSVCVKVEKEESLNQDIYVLNVNMVG